MPKGQSAKSDVGGRLRGEFLLRVEDFCEHVVVVSVECARQKAPLRLCDQICASGTSVGANLFEAAEAMSVADFRKSLAISLKELNETRFWLRLSQRRGWADRDRLVKLEQEAVELKLILGSILTKTAAPKRESPAKL